MKILYISSMVDSETYKRSFTKEKKPMHAANKYHTLICKGLAENGVSVNAYSVLPINRSNCDKWIVRASKKNISENFKIKYSSLFNLPIFKNIHIFIKSFFKGIFLPRNIVIIYDALLISASLGVAYGAKISGKKIVGIVTDLPKFQPISQNEKMLAINEKLLRMADGYIFLTEQMNGVVNVNNKPFTIVEGLVDSEMISRRHADFDPSKKRILYAGSLKKIYGIKRLCEAFLKCALPNEELHIYGDGDYVPELLELIENNQKNNILFHGNRPNDEIVEAELHATLLVNPRPTEDEYTIFSFPSKIIEYMVSGTPVLTTKLQGIPMEYDEYLFYFDDKKIDGLELALRSILDMETDVLFEKGRRARDFVLQKKSNLIQSKRIIDFLKSNYMGV